MHIQHPAIKHAFIAVPLSCLLIIASFRLGSASSLRLRPILSIFRLIARTSHRSYVSSPVSFVPSHRCRSRRPPELSTRGLVIIPHRYLIVSQASGLVPRFHERGLGRVRTALSPLFAFTSPRLLPRLFLSALDPINYSINFSPYGHVGLPPLHYAVFHNSLSSVIHSMSTSSWFIQPARR